MANTKTRTVEVKVPDGTEMSMYVATPESSQGAPGILVFQEAFGVNAHIRDVTERFAREGFVAAAPELFHRTAKHFVAAYHDYDSISPHMSKVTPETLRGDSRTAFDWLTKEGGADPAKIAAVGYCMGGRAAYVANSAVPLKAAISYYGGRIAPDLLPLAKDQHGPIMLIWGGADSHIPPEQYRAVSDALIQAHKPYTEVVFSDAGHGFFCDEKKEFHAEAASESWELVKRFLKNKLGLR